MTNSHLTGSGRFVFILILALALAAMTASADLVGETEGDLQNSLPFIVALGVVAFLLIYWAFQFNDEDHTPLKLMASIFFVIILVLIAKATLDSSVSSCFLVIKNTTTTGAVNQFVDYNYNYICVDNYHTTPQVFYRTIIWFSRAFAVYMFIYLNYAFWIKTLLARMGIINKKKPPENGQQ